MLVRKVVFNIQNYIKKYILTHKNEIINYTWTRAIIVTYLTLMNGRLGQEVAQITLKEYNVALEGAWLKKVCNTLIHRLLII